VLRAPRPVTPDLPRPVWIVEAGLALSWLGNGAVAPFLLIYLHNVQGLTLSAAGLAVAVGSAAALVTGPSAGSVVDRLGARPVLAGSLLVAAAGIAALVLVRHPWHAFVALALAGAGNGGYAASQSALVAALTPRYLLPSAFAVQRVAIHAGAGLGAIAGGLVVSAGRPAAFSALLLFDAFTFMAFAGLLVLVAEARSPATGGRPRYGTVLRNRPLVGFLMFNALAVAGGVAPMASFLPVFARNEAAVAEAWIGALVFLDGAVVVAAQLPVAHALAGRRRMTALVLMTVLWGVALLVAGSAAIFASVALPVLVGATLLFAAGKCLHGAVQNPLTADLAQPGALGRSMALLAASWQIGLGAGAAIGGLVFDAEPLVLWPLAAFVCIAAGGVALALERGLPAQVRRSPRRAEIPLPAIGA
jgi:predicted MFS family arabinose efflux permease